MARRATLLAVLALLLAAPAHAAPGPGAAEICSALRPGVVLPRCALPALLASCREDPGFWSDARACRRGLAAAWRAAAARDRARAPERPAERPAGEESVGGAPLPAPAPGGILLEPAPGGGLLSPGVPEGYERVGEDPRADPLAALGAGRGGAPHPVNHYMLDVRIDTGLDDVTGNFYAVFQQAVLQPVWLSMVWALRLAMAALAMSFELNLLSGAMARAREFLAAGRERITEPWLLAAIAGAGLWGIWRGLVQGRIAQTAGGLGLTVALMVGGLYVISDPEATIGAAGALADEGAREIFSGLSGLGGAERGVAGAEAGLFAAVITPAWCALQFGDVDFCTGGEIPEGTPHRRRGEGPAPATPAGVWLQWPANGREREAIYEHWRDGGGIPAARVKAMQKEATAGRVVMLGLVAASLLGAVILFGLVAMRLVAYALLALVLLLMTPVMMLVGAFGDTGRRAVGDWARWLLGSLLGKLIYAVLLAVILLATNLLAGLAVGGFLGTWLLLGVLWWMMIVHRNRFVEWLSAGGQDQRMGGGALRALGAAYLGGRMLTSAGRAGAIPIRAGRRRLDAVRTVRSEGARASAGRGLDAHAERSLTERLRGSRDLLDTGEHDRRELEGVRAALAPAERARGEGAASPLEPREEGRLRFRQAVLETRARAQAPALERARITTRRAAENEAREGRPFSVEDLSAERERLDREDAQAGRKRERAALAGDPRELRAHAARMRRVSPPREDAGAPEPDPARPPEDRAAERAERDVLRASAPAQRERLAPARGAVRARGEDEFRREWQAAARGQRQERREHRRRRRLYRTPRI